MAHFQTKNPNLGKFRRFLQLKMLEYFIAIWYISRPLVYFMAIWYIFLRFGMLQQEKSGNPVSNHLPSFRLPPWSNCRFKCRIVLIDSHRN
jgi:hypothetical protein